MKLVIDCFKQIKGVGKSIGIYNVAKNIINGLVEEKKVTSDDKIKNTEIIVLGNEFNELDFNVEGVTFVKVSKYSPTNKVHCVLWELFGVIRICKQLNADKVLFPRGYVALTHPIEDIIIIHDLIPFYYDAHFPGVFNKAENGYIMNRLKSSAKTASKIITISETSKKDIVKYCGVSENKIKVIYNACKKIDYPEKKQDQGYICAITSGLPHKNAIGVLESYKRYWLMAENPLPLVVIGIEDTGICDLPNEVKNDIQCIKFIKDEQELYGIVRNSTLFLFLSLIEGFGLPPLEAMQLGVPVICSGQSSLPEVTGDAAVLVDPKDAESVANEIRDLASSCKKREELIEKGKRNIERFSEQSRAKLYWKAILEE